MNDQHAYLRCRADEADPPQVGDLIGCGISHPCTTFDKWRVAVHGRRRLSRHRRDPHLLLIAFEPSVVRPPRSPARPPVGDLLVAMRESSASLSQAQRQVAAAMLDDPEFALHANVDALARRAGVSPPTITRFCRALGYSGLREFKLRLAHTLAVGKSTLHRAVKGGDDMQAVTHKVLQDAVSALSNLERHVVPEDLERAATRIARARRVDCYGVGNVSMFMASDAQARFARLGMNGGAYFDAHLQLISAATMTRRDVVLAISYVGRMRSLLQAVAVAREQGAMVVAITQPRHAARRDGRRGAAGRRSGRPRDARRHRSLPGATDLSRDPDGGRRPAPRAGRLQEAQARAPGPEGTRLRERAASGHALGVTGATKELAMPSGTGADSPALLLRGGTVIDGTRRAALRRRRAHRGRAHRRGRRESGGQTAPT